MSSSELPMHRRRADTYVTRLMGALFGLGAVGFVAGPLDAYANRVGAHGDALTFFVASVLLRAAVWRSRGWHIRSVEPIALASLPGAGRGFNRSAPSCLTS